MQSSKQFISSLKLLKSTILKDYRMYKFWTCLINLAIFLTIESKSFLRNCINLMPSNNVNPLY